MRSCVIHENILFNLRNLTVIQSVSEESPGKDTAYTPRRDDIQRLALMIYSHKWLMIYTASRDYGVKCGE